MKKDKKSSGYWTSKTNCRRVANKCKTKSEMQKRFPSAYFSSVKNGWIDEFFPNSTKRGKLFWTKENCQEEAKKYKTRSEFSFKCNRAYRVSLDNGWLEEFGFLPKDGYTKDECAKLASECTGRNDFQAKYASAYKLSVDRGWINDFFGRRNVILTKMFNTINGKYTSPTDFKKRSPVQYKYAKEHGILGMLFPDSKAKDCQTVWSYDNCKEEASKYSSRSEFREKSKTAYFISVYYCWLNDFFPHPNKPKRTKKIWTKEECAEIAAQCNGRIEFCKKKASAYRYAQQQGWLDEFFGVKNKITKEKCRKSAEYYKKSSLLKKYAPAVYKKCIFSGWLEEFFPDEMNTITANEKTIRHRILDFVEANGPQTKDDLYRIMLTIAGQNIKRRDWGIAYVDNVSYGTSVFLPTKSDKRYLKQVRDFDFKTPKYGIAEVKRDEE